MASHRLLREPLLHFLVLGALLFVAYGWLNRGALLAPDEVVVDQARADAMAVQFARVWQRPPTRAELDGLIERWVRDEIVYREGVAAGMDRDDEVVRRRVVQKMNFLTEGMAAEVPSDAELEAWLREHPDDYRIAPRYTLRQVYFALDRHGDGLDAALAAARVALDRNPQAELGDPSLLPRSLSNADPDEVERHFGEQFAAALATLPDGGWSEPVPSAFGAHLVRVESRTPGRAPELAEVRQAVARDLLSARSRKANDDFYAAMRERYTVRVDADLDRASLAVGNSNEAGSPATAGGSP